MDLQAYRDEIRLRLTGDLLDLEISDATMDKIIHSALREVQRYICSTRVLTTTYSKCIDLSSLTDEFDRPLKISTVTNIFRTVGFTSNSSTSGYADPMYAMQWQVLGGVGNLYNFQNSVLNYGAWSTMQQIRNTLSTDLSYYFDKSANKLYINSSQGNIDRITIEYIPRYDSVEEINSDYWIDVLVRMSVAIAKITVGRIRTRFTATGALWTQDGEKILEEGTTELNELRTHLIENSQLMYPID